MAKVQFTAEVEPELLQQIERAAESDDTSVDQWVQRAIRDRLQGASGRRQHAVDAKPRGSSPPITIMSGHWAESVLEDEAQQRDDVWPPDYQRGVRSAKRPGSENAPSLRGGKSMSEIVIEDRR